MRALISILVLVLGIASAQAEATEITIDGYVSHPAEAAPRAVTVGGTCAVAILALPIIGVAACACEQYMFEQGEEFGKCYRAILDGRKR